jgi:hypothetical protein
MALLAVHASPPVVSTASRRWDFTAIRAGAVISLVFAVPLAIGARIAADGDHDGVAVSLSIGATIGFLIGAGCAAWIQRAGTPLSHGMVTAGGTYIITQAVFIAVRLIRGEDVRWFGTVFTFTIVLFAGLVGGLLGRHLQASGFQPSAKAERKEQR